MESFSQPPSPQESPEAYRTPEIGELERDFCSLVEKLRGAIDENRYTLLVSDEVGGRLPTLALRRVISMRHPGEAPRVSFVNGGRSLQSVFSAEGEAGLDSVADYLRLATGAGHHALVVTQIVDSGNSIGLLADAVRRSGAESVEVASVRSIWQDQRDGLRGESAKRLDGVPFTVGGTGHTYNLDPKAAELGGVAKPPAPPTAGEAAAGYRMHPRPFLEVIEETGREQFETRESRKEALGIVKEDDVYARLEKMRQGEKDLEESYLEPVSDEERARARAAMVGARADVDLLARRAVEAVWGKEAGE